MKQIMRKLWQENFILFIIFILLLAFWFYKIPEKPVIAIDKEKIVAIQIDFPEKASVILNKQSNTWIIKEPIVIEAEQERIIYLLNLLTSISHWKQSIDVIDLSAFGLDPPQASLQLNQHKIIFGKLYPEQNMRYIQIEKYLYLVAEQYFPLLESAVPNFTSRNLIPSYKTIKDIHFSLEWSNMDAEKIKENWQISKALWLSQGILDKGIMVELVLSDDTILKYQVLVNAYETLVYNPATQLIYHFPKHAYDKLVP